MLREESRPWYNALATNINANGDLFNAAFLLEYRKMVKKTEKLIKIGPMKMKRENCVRRFLEKVQRVAKKIDIPPVNSMLMSWFDHLRDHYLDQKHP